MSSHQQTRAWSQSANLSQVLKAEAVLNGDKSEVKTSNPSGLADILLLRLQKFDELIDGTSKHRDLDVDSLRLDTAFASLYVLERVHNILIENEAHSLENKVPVTPLIGTKDMSQLRTTLSVVYGWGTEVLLKRILSSLPNKRSSCVPPGAQIIDLTSTHDDHNLLTDIINRILAIVFPDGEDSKTTSFVTTMILSRGFSDLLRSCICLGWFPNEIDSSTPTSNNIRPCVERLTNKVPPSQAIASLGQILSKSGAIPKYASKVCSTLLSLQLQRPAGVAGLLSATFGEDPTETDAPLSKLESVAKILNVPPNNLSHEVYFAMIMPRLLHLLSPSMETKTPPSHKRAAAFALSRMILASAQVENSSSDVRQVVLNRSLLDVFRTRDNHLILPQSKMSKKMENALETAPKSVNLHPVSAVSTLSTIITNTDPSPELISLLLQPIIPQLYSLLEHLQSSKTVDPILLETIEGLLSTWVRAATRIDVVRVLWEVIEGESWDWEIDDDGELAIVRRLSELPSLTLSQLADLQEGKIEDEEENTLGMRPNPLKFSRFLKKMGRDDVSSALYLKIIDSQVKSDATENPLRRLKLLKLSMQISEDIGETAPENSLLKNPEVMRILMFIKLSLDQDKIVKKAETNEKMTLDSLRFMPNGDDDDEGDSDDEDLAPGLEGIDRKEHLTATAINLLMTLLQEHPELSPRTVPLLNEIYSYLESLANSDSDALRPRARDARLLLTARMASSTSGKGSKLLDGEVEEQPQEKYQRALKLLQDPLLPVRAHGLLLLRELVSPAKHVSHLNKSMTDSKTKSGATIRMTQGAKVATPPIDSALVPSILSIFLQSIQDDDSYIFLNSVQGLTAMVDGFGKEVLRGLVSEYTKGIDRPNSFSSMMPTRELDMRVRIGEALGQVIKRCGSALGNYVDILVPPIFAVVRGKHFPTAWRTSAISLLATAADTYILALIMYAADLVPAMIDLVQVESVVIQSKAKTNNVSDSTEGDNEVPSKSPVGKEAIISDEQSNEKQGRKQKKLETVASGMKDEASPNGKNGQNEEDSQSTMDAQPTLPNPKFPPLRRAALHLLSLFTRALTKHIYDHEKMPIDISGLVVKRGITTLVYVSVTDVDDVVRVMARETAEQLELLRKAIVGL